jgi:prepilin-type N-terminal cleavage/methylation domain-containing protein
MRTRSIRIKSIVCSLKPAVRPLSSDLRPVTSARGFTLIELLVAMSLLMVIVLMLSNLFQQSTRAWGTGLRQAEIGLEARAAINIIEHDLSQAVASSNPGQQFTATPTELTFAMFSRTNSTIEQVTYDFSAVSGLTRNDVKLVGGDSIDSFSVSVPSVGSVSGSTELPDLVAISLTMSSSKNFSEVRVYVQGREYEEGGTTWVDTHREN